MSPTPSGPSPHTRATSINGSGPTYTTNDLKMNGTPGTNGGNRVFAHLDDLVAVRPDVDINSPMRTILQQAEILAKQADTHLDFRRPDIALQEYIKASIVAIEIIPRHKEFAMLQSGQGELNRMYAGLKKRINTQHPRFAEVKILIKENNAKSGVQPVGVIAAAAPRSNGTNGHIRAQSVQSTPLHPTTNGVPRQKPQIHPKPNGLQGNAIPSIPSDLASRFAGLRSGGTNIVVQDPRIRTQSIPGSMESPTPARPNYTTINRPTGPREMPSVPTSLPGTPKPILDVNIPQFPRAPDAIYSPSQNADTPAAANLLSSVPRSGSYVGAFRAAPPISTHVPTPKIQEMRNEYFPPAHIPEKSTIQPKKASAPVIPNSTTVTAEDLMTYLQYGSHTLKVLLIDVRSREQFESGHILTPSIICVEPITIRPGISAEQLGDSMIINPDSEQALYDHRHDFDLIVFYDQSSSALKSSGGDDSLLHFSRAVYEHDYEKQLKRRPMLLVGGLDAWTDLLGPASLKATTSRSSSPAPDSTSRKHGRPLGRFPPARKPPAVPLKRRKTHSSRPLTKEEEEVWDQTLRADSDQWKSAEAERANSAELVYAKTTEDFFRRYPELPAIQESMTSALPPNPVPNTMVRSTPNQPPPPPARPAPALPRQRSSGLFERGPIMVPAHSAQQITEPLVPPGLTGLTNSSCVTCYMNAALQAISATPFLRDFLARFNRTIHPVPRKSGELSDPPQLMVRSFNILINHLWSGQYNFLTPQSFSKYVNSVHAGSLTDERVRNCAYGGTVRQHDSAEFFNFLIEILDDELNPRRHLPPVNIDDPTYEAAVRQPRLEDAATYAWNAQCAREDSVITRRMKGMLGRTTYCSACQGVSRTFELFTYLTLNIPIYSGALSLQQLFQAEYGRSEQIDDYTCANCKNSHVKATRHTVLCYVPDYLVIQVNRYNNDLQRLSNKINWPETGLNLSGGCIPTNEVSRNTDPRVRGPFMYDTYSVTMHIGQSISSGHYLNFARSPDKLPTGNGDSAGRWHKFNDRDVTPATFAETQGGQGSRNGLATVIYLRRQGCVD